MRRFEQIERLAGRSGRSGHNLHVHVHVNRRRGVLGDGAQIQQTIDTAATAEALAVTYLSAVIKKAPGAPVAKFAHVLKAANAEEYDHFKALEKLGAKPIATKFWAPMRSSARICLACSPRWRWPRLCSSTPT